MGFTTTNAGGNWNVNTSGYTYAGTGFGKQMVELYQIQMEVLHQQYQLIQQVDLVL
jgi:hypothetical protein